MATDTERPISASRGLATCPRCGHKGILTVGRGLYPYVEHRFPATHPANPYPGEPHETSCFVARDDPLVVAAIEKRGE